MGEAPVCCPQECARFRAISCSRELVFPLFAQYRLAMDLIDDRILQVLEREARISNAALAERVGLSASACLRRVQELERRAVIRGYRAVIDRQATGRGFVAYVGVGLADHSKAAQAGFERAIAAAAAVRECHNITGGIEYLLRVEVADLDAYKAFHTDVLGTMPGVRSLVTYVVMGTPTDRRG
jgi:DNA-binding Lrp family transcriptional regulator